MVELCPPLFRPHRHEFDSEQIPDLTRDVFRQDIHSVGSLCKLYFRELPNPLLTYQLYDRFSVRAGAAAELGQRIMSWIKMEISVAGSSPCAEGTGGWGNAHLHGSNYIFKSSNKLGHCIVWSSLATAGEMHAETSPNSATAPNAKEGQINHADLYIHRRPCLQPQMRRGWSKSTMSSSSFPLHITGHV